MTTQTPNSISRKQAIDIRRYDQQLKALEMLHWVDHPLSRTKTINVRHHDQALAERLSHTCSMAEVYFLPDYEQC